MAPDGQDVVEQAREEPIVAEAPANRPKLCWIGVSGPRPRETFRDLQVAVLPWNVILGAPSPGPAARASAGPASALYQASRTAPVPSTFPPRWAKTHAGERRAAGVRFLW